MVSPSLRQIERSYISKRYANETWKKKPSECSLRREAACFWFLVYVSSVRLNTSLNRRCSGRLVGDDEDRYGGYRKPTLTLREKRRWHWGGRKWKRSLVPTVSFREVTSWSDQRGDQGQSAEANWYRCDYNVSIVGYGVKGAAVIFNFAFVG